METGAAAEFMVRPATAGDMRRWCAIAARCSRTWIRWRRTTTPRWPRRRPSLLRRRAAERPVPRLGRFARGRAGAHRGGRWRAIAAEHAAARANWGGVQPAGMQALIVNVYTDPAWRRQGLAELIMRTILAWCQETGMVSVALHASSQGRALYERLGFEASNEMYFPLRRSPRRGAAGHEARRGPAMHDHLRARHAAAVGRPIQPRLRSGRTRKAS